MNSMAPLAIMQNDWWDVWGPLLFWGAIAVASSLSYRRFNYGRLFDDPGNAMNPFLPNAGRRVVSAFASDEINRRQHSGQDELSPADLTHMRIRADRKLRERWAVIDKRFGELRADPGGESWDGIVNGELGLMALLTDLALELHACKHKPTYPPVVLQLEGPLGTLAEIVRHAQQAVDPATPAREAQGLRASVLQFVSDVFPGICENIRETEVHYNLDPEYHLASEVEIASQDLPTE